MTERMTTSRPPNFPGPRVLGICGGIAVGKSTFGKNFVDRAKKTWAGHEVVFEEEQVIQPLLSAYLKDPVAYGSDFQTVMGMAAAKRQQRAEYLRDVQEPKRMILLERPLWENVVFAEANVRFGSFTKAYYYDFYMPLIEAHHSSHPDLLVYLHASERTRSFRREDRKRADEDLYKDRYMNILGDCYFDFVIEHAAKRKLLVLNWNDYGDMHKVLATVSAVLNGDKQLPRVVRNELSSSSDSSSEDGAPAQMTITVKEQTSFFETLSTKKRRKAQDLVMEALANFQDVVINN